MIRLKGGRYLPPQGEFTEGNVVFSQSGILGAGSGTQPGFPQEDCTEIDVSGCTVIPGLVDIHTHGAAGIDVMKAEPEELAKLTRFYAQQGVTSFLPTTMTATREEMRTAVRRIAAASKRSDLGAAIEGVHIEGPYISTTKRGCHKEHLIRGPLPGELEEYEELLGRLKLRITVAPELPGAEGFIRRVVADGGSVTLGHSDASSALAREAVGWGANSYTHLFNAMRSLHHREPGIIGEALLDDAYVELICDGFHLHPDIVRLVARLKPDRVALMTDSMPAAGFAEGVYEFGGFTVTVKEGTARIADGTLAGSTLLLRRGVENYARFTGCSFAQAVRCASIHPARVIGTDGLTGSIEPGKRADLVVLDADHEVVLTFCAGKKVYDRASTH